MFDEDKLPKRTLGPCQGWDGPSPNWVTCAHGTKVEALYSVLAGWNEKEGGLRASENKDLGQ
eukprot:684516-Karenia_brevis.AAC.1